MKKLVLLLFFPLVLLGQTNTARMNSGSNVITSFPYTMLASDVTKIDVFQPSANSFVIFPAAGSSGFEAGKVFSIKNDSNNYTITLSSTSYISGQLSITLATEQGADIYSTGTTYEIQPGAGSGSIPGGATLSTQYNNAGSLGGAANGISGQILGSTNNSAPAFVSPGLSDSANSPVTASTYTIACDTGTTIVDRAHLIRFQSGAATVTVPLSTGSGCAGLVTSALDDGAGTLTFNATSPDIFTVLNGSTNLDSQSSFTLSNGQYATISQSASGIWEIRITAGGSSVAWENQGSGIGTPTTVNCSTNITCSYGSNTVTITASASSSEAWSSITGSATNTNTGFKLAPTNTSTVPWTHTCPTSLSVDCYDWYLNTTKEAWIDDGGEFHLNQVPGWPSQTANYFWAAPNGSSGAPTFRAIVAADLPTALASSTSVNGTSIPSSATLCTTSSVCTGYAASGASTTVNSQTCTLGSTCTIPYQVNGTGMTSQAGINHITSTTNSVGLTVTPSNPSSNEVKFEVTGSSYTGNAATASNLSGCTGSAEGDICYYTGSAWARLAGNSSGTQFLQETSAGSPSWATPSGSGNVSTSGSPAEYETAVWASGTTITGVGPGTTGYPLVSAGASSNPSFSQLTSTGLNITTTSCSSQVVTAISSGGVGTCTSLTTGYLPALFQTNSSNNSTDTNINMETSTANAVGLTVTPTNSSGAIEKFEITGSSYTGNAATVTTAASTTNSSYSILSVPSTSGSQEPYTVASFTINPSTGAVNIPGALTVSSCSGCGSVSLSFPLTVSGTTTQYHFPIFATTTSLANDSTLSDNGTTLAYTGTGGITSSGPLALGSSPPTACGSISGCLAMNEGSSAGTPTSAEDYMRGDSSTHSFACSLNDGSESACNPLIPSSATSGHLVAWGTWPAQTDSGIVDTASGFNTVIQGLTGCNTSGYVYTPQAADCVALSGSGPTVEVNGSSSGLTSTVNFNSTTPAAGSNNQNLTLQVSTDNVSIEVPQATTGQAGVVELAGALAGTYTSPALANATSCTNQVVTAISSSTAAGTCTSLTEAYMPVVNTVVDTSATVTVSTTNAAEFHFNENSTAATAITYDLPTAAAGKQFCFSNAYNGSGANTGTLTLQTSAAGQYIIFTDGTLSASDGYVISAGAARDSSCVVGVDSTHWALYTQSGTWTKH